MQPGQPAVGAHAGLVEAGHRCGGDPVSDDGQHPVDDPEGGAFDPARHRRRGHREPEQVPQRVRGTADGQELPVQQVHADPGQPRPVGHGCGGLCWCGAAGAVPATTGHRHELMLGDHDYRIRDVEHLPTGHRHLDGTGQAVAAPAADLRYVPDDHVRVGDLFQGGPGLPRRASRSTSGLLAQDWGAGLTRPSDDGGLDEFLDDIPRRASGSAIRARACSSRAANSTFSASSCSYDGCGESADTNSSTNQYRQPY